MPFRLNATVNVDGTQYERGDIVNDVIGDAIRAEHSSAVTRVPHDDHLCADECHHRTAAAEPAAPVAAAPSFMRSNDESKTKES